MNNDNHIYVAQGVVIASAIGCILVAVGLILILMLSR